MEGGSKKAPQRMQASEDAVGCFPTMKTALFNVYDYKNNIQIPSNIR